MDVLSILGYLPAWLWLILLSFVLLFIYGYQGFDVFEKLGIPGPKPWMFVGHIFQIGTPEVINNWRKEFGDIFGFYMGRNPAIVVNDLDVLKEILVKDFAHFTDRQVRMTTPFVEKGVFFQGGANWKRIRSIITPTFSSGKLKHMLGSINRCGELLSDNLVSKARNGETIDVKHYFGAYTMDVIATTAFGLDIDSQTNPDEPFVQNARALFAQAGFNIPFIMTMIFPFLRKFFRMLNTGPFPAAPRLFFVKSIQELIEQRKNEDPASQARRTDFIHLLLKAESEDGHDSSSNVTVKRLSSEEVIGQIFLFFIAGFETTATTLNYVSYALVHHPEIQEKIMEEIEEHIGDREPTYDDISKLTYMEQVIMETLRMYPPVPLVNRKASAEVKIKGVTIPEGMTVVIPIYAVHHNPENYPNPEQFLPERFEQSVKRDNNPVTFLPFGFGPRLCIGMRLALVEAKVALVYTLRKIRFVKCPQTTETLTFKTSGLLTPKNPIIVGGELIN